VSAVLDPSAADQAPLGGQARLTETPIGWTLQIDLGADLAAIVAERLTQGGCLQYALTDFAISISPNLVPGEPFTISSLELTVGST
jgi:hypothetical protein